jgi:tetratricopeptide (TPR) repeat protein
VPPIYYCDWQAAGRWLNEHSPPHARVLTRHSDVGFTSRRFQDSVRFEEISPRQLRERILSFRARYLVVPTTLYGSLIRNQALTGGPTYRFEPVYESGDVQVLEVVPNRAGVVPLQDHTLEDRLRSCREASDRNPFRIDLKRRLAELLHQAGRGEEAVSVLEQFSRTTDDARVLKTMAEILLDLGRSEEALEVYRQAATLPKADLLTRSLARGTSRAEALLAAGKTGSPREQARRLAESAYRKLQALSITKAVDEIEQAIRLSPDDDTVWLVHALVLEMTGDRSQAETILERLSLAGNPQAREHLNMLQREKALLEGRIAAQSGEYLEVAAALMAGGSPGRALAVLESGSERLPGSGDILFRLADMYLFYARPERSEPLYRKILAARPDHQQAQRGLEVSLQLMKKADF